MRQGTKWGVRLPGIGRYYCLYSFLRVSANFAGNQSTFYEDCNHIGTGKKCTSTFSLQKIEFFKLTVGIYIFLREVPLFHKMKMMDPRRFNRLVGFFSFDAVYTVSMFSVCEIMMPWFNFKENNLYFIFYFLLFLFFSYWNWTFLVCVWYAGAAVLSLWMGKLISILINIAVLASLQGDHKVAVCKIILPWDNLNKIVLLNIIFFQKSRKVSGCIQFLLAPLCPLQLIKPDCFIWLQKLPLLSSNL